MSRTEIWIDSGNEREPACTKSVPGTVCAGFALELLERVAQLMNKETACETLRHLIKKAQAAQATSDEETCREAMRTIFLDLALAHAGRTLETLNQ